jgi:hypothetical protein
MIAARFRRLGNLSISGAIVVLACPMVGAEELDIGHLEATDDIGINWQY